MLRNFMGTTLIGLLLAAAPLFAVSAQSPTPESATVLKPGANSFAESQARDLLVKDGYADVSPLVNDKNGIWRGKATKNRKPVDVSVDFQGRIAAE